MFLRPIKGRSVADPARGDLLPASGRNVEPSTYWYRRLADKDVTEITSLKKRQAKNDYQF